MMQEGNMDADKENNIKWAAGSLYGKMLIVFDAQITVSLRLNLRWL